ncbi:hypothetical protein DRJ17_01375 [Candidatus Woesearchaeota archaeon]|nr:MAG: hypothetical protein DRJ17_01375 [Candidatus Woesearchaeota archaeon]
MASLLDLSLAQHFAVIFALLFIFVVVYAILQYTKFLEADKNVHALIAFIVAFLFILSPQAINAVTNFAPWFTMFFVFATFFIAAYTLFGIKTEDIAKVIKHPTAAWTLGILAFVVGAAAIGAAFGQTFLEFGAKAGIPGVTEPGEITDLPINTTAGYVANVQRTLFDPKVIGLFFVMAIAIATIKLLAGKAIA